MDGGEIAWKKSEQKYFVSANIGEATYPGAGTCTTTMRSRIYIIPSTPSTPPFDSSKYYAYIEDSIARSVVSENRSY